VVSVVAVAVALTGLAGKAAKAAGSAAGAAKGASVTLPEWAPKNPSKEFLRATRVLKPVPLESEKVPGRSDAENAARIKGKIILWLAAYEFFGTLSDKQVTRFLQVRQMVLPAGVPGRPPRRVRGNQVVIPVKQLTKRQRAALDRYFEADREASKGQSSPGHPGGTDCLLDLYKMGAKRDLSNVRVGFDTAQGGAGHTVSVVFYVTRPDGSIDSNWLVSSFAQM
jgi:hypothetical protein